MLIRLPEPRLMSEVSLEEALLSRRSIRDFRDAPVTMEEVSQVLWAAQGVTSKWGGRTAPSAGALYPLEVYLVAGDVEGLDAGVYRYRPRGHELILVRTGDARQELAEAAVGQSFVQDAAISLVIGAFYTKTTVKYGDRGIRYVHMEAGHAAQNICLQATALGLGAVPVGAFHDDWVRRLVGMGDDEAPLYVIPVGNRK